MSDEWRWAQMDHPGGSSRRRRVLWAALAALVLVGSGVGIGLLVSGDNGSKSRPSASSATSSSTSTTTPTPTTATTATCVIPGAGTDRRVGTGTAGPMTPGILSGLDARVSGQPGSGAPVGVPTCAEHVVFTFGSTSPGYTVEYRAGPLTLSPSDNPVTVQGSAYLIVRFETAANHTGGPGVSEQLIPPGTHWVREVRQLEDFEGVNIWAIGLTAQLPFVVTSSGSSIWVTVGG